MLTDTAPDDFAAQVAAADAQEKAAYDAQQNAIATSGPSTATIAYTTVGSLVGFAHGYKRNKGSVGWGLVWALFGGISPLFTTGVAVIEGFGKPKQAK